MFAKLKAILSNTANRTMNKTTMVATCNALVRVIYADGSVEDSELETVMSVARNNPKLASFGGEFNREIEKVLASFKDSPRMGRLAANRAISDFATTATFEDKEDLFVACLDVMEADGNVDDAEMNVIREIGGILGLNLNNYL